jgi:hypothetical protein
MRRECLTHRATRRHFALDSTIIRTSALWRCNRRDHRSYTNCHAINSNCPTALVSLPLPSRSKGLSISHQDHCAIHEASEHPASLDVSNTSLTTPMMGSKRPSTSHQLCRDIRGHRHTVLVVFTFVVGSRRLTSHPPPCENFEETITQLYHFSHARREERSRASAIVR